MNRAERRRAGKAGAITPGVVWSFIIVRRERDLPNLLAALEAGDPIAQQFFAGLPQWLKLWRDAAVPPLCLTCEHAFATQAPPPGTFAKLVCVAIDGRPIGFSNTRPAPGVH